MKRLTVGDLKRIVRLYPDDAIVCLYSDSEGNTKSVAMDAFGETVGEEETFEYNGKDFSFVGGEDVEGIDLETDKGKRILFLQPSL